MKRMIPQALITWVKSLFTRIHPGDKEGDIEIDGNLEVDGDVNVNGRYLCVENIALDKDDYTKPSIGFGESSFVVNIRSTILNISNSSATLTVPTYIRHNFYISNGYALVMGTTSLTEAQLQKLIALIPTE